MARPLPPLDTPTTPRQRQVLGFIAKHQARHARPPTWAELAARFGWRSTHSVSCHLVSLARRGLVAWEPGHPRTLALTPRGHAEIHHTPVVALEGGAR